MSASIMVGCLRTGGKLFVACSSWEGEYAQMWMIATPTKPGWCRCLWWFFAPAQTASKRTKTLARLPTWLDHQTRSAGALWCHLSFPSLALALVLGFHLQQQLRCQSAEQGEKGLDFGLHRRRKMMHARPLWCLHSVGLTASDPCAVFDGDNVFLHGADRIAHGLEEATGSKWKGAYFMPAQADR